jgi:Cof subfamily protein (haloacid dehalogenase superfamily)
MDIKLIAFDLDGTLLDKSVKLPPINIRALRQCEELGIRLMLCSGRAFEVQAEIAGDAGISPILASANGARIDAGPDGPILRECTMERNLAERIYAILMEKGVYFMVYARGRSYVANPREQERLGKHRHAPGVALHGGRPYETVCDEKRLVEEGLSGAYKFVCFGEDYDPRFDELAPELDKMGLSISSSWRDNMEIMSPGVDKGDAVGFVAGMYGISMENVMAFGDNSNDLPMLERVGWPVAMANAEPCALGAARLVAPDHDAGGVGIALNEFVLSNDGLRRYADGQV